MLRGKEQQNRRGTNAKTRSTIVADEMPAKLRSLMKRFESQSNSGHLTPRKREQRLVQMRAEIAAVANKEARSFCNCKKITVAFGRYPEEFEAEMKLACPIHGRRNLGVVVSAIRVPHLANDLRLLELLERYHRSSLEFGG